jgi:biopolymer transport protein ExbD
MKITSPLPERKARIEIIPLIDIMFFLLAAFMLASLALIHLKTIRVHLPAASVATPQFESTAVNIDVDRQGDIYVDRKPMTVLELRSFLSAQVQADPNVPVYISGDRDATHGQVIRALDIARAAGVQRVSFAVTAEDSKP